MEAADALISSTNQTESWREIIEMSIDDEISVASEDVGDDEQRQKEGKKAAKVRG